MIKIELLKNHPEAIPQLAHIWHEVLGKIWVPDVPVERVITRFAEHLNDQVLPITFVALDGDLPVGMCSLRENDDDLIASPLARNDGGSMYKLSAAIDFGGAAVGDPACDLVIAWTYLSGKAREIFISKMDMDSDTWLRARAWALWKATFELCQIVDKNSSDALLQKTIISNILNHNQRR